jgi:hypothetical protein
MLVVRNSLPRYELRTTNYYARPKGAEARGIVAEPPKRGDAHLVAPWCDSAQTREGDGADSPTQARRRRAKRLAQI